MFERREYNAYLSTRQLYEKLLINQMRYNRIV